MVNLKQEPDLKGAYFTVPNKTKKKKKKDDQHCMWWEENGFWE